MARAKKPVGEILLELGAIDPLQLQAALAFQQQWDMRLGKAVVERGFCSKDDVTRALAMQAGYPMIHLDGVPLDDSLAALVPVRVAEQHRVVPLRLEGRRREVLAVASAAPASLSAIDAVLAVAGKQRAAVHIAHDDAITAAIGRLYHHTKEPVAPSIQPLAQHVVVYHEQTLDLPDDGEAKAAQTPSPVPRRERPVALFGWHEATMRALTIMISRGGVVATPISDEQLAALEPDDVLIASTLGLQAVLAAGERPPVRLIICGVTGAIDVDDAKQLGATLYLRPPFSTEQLVEAVRAARNVAA